MNGPKATQMKGLLAASISTNAVVMWTSNRASINFAELAIESGLQPGLEKEVMNDEVCMRWRHYLGRRSYV